MGAHTETKYRTLEVDLGDRSYPIHIGVGILDLLGETLARSKNRGTVAVVTDDKVGPLYGDRVKACVESAGFRCFSYAMASGESNKRLEQVELLCGAFLEGGLDRSSTLVALGGGVVGDTAGFAAASFMRGIDYIQIPTTIVAQVDSSVGGKTGVNHPLAKNIIGAFHQPAAVIIDMSFLSSLPEREYRAGLAEVIKHGIIADADLFAYMEDRADAILSGDLALMEYPVYQSCVIKSAIVAEDEKEHGKRADLNYGHTFGHAIEAVTGYGHFLHGEAIALGMCAAGHLSQSLGLVDDDFVARQRACFEAYKLPVEWPAVPVSDTLAAMKHDKKALGGTLKFVVADRVGHVVHRTDVTEEQARAAIASLAPGD